MSAKALIAFLLSLTAMSANAENISHYLKQNYKVVAAFAVERTADLNQRNVVVHHALILQKSGSGQVVECWRKDEAGQRWNCNPTE